LCEDRFANVNLFSTIAIGSVALRNRTAVAPMTRVSAADDGCVTGAMVDYYVEFARGGWGLVAEATYIDDAHSRCRDRQPASTAAQRDAWRRVVDGVHARGGDIHATAARRRPRRSDSRRRRYGRAVGVVPRSPKPLCCRAS
jgi:2,4-dienoyl-CoA reductase-like NADH-dependent reductase (Old Yellow Enzyme family)